MLATIVLILCVASWAYWLLTLFLIFDFFRVAPDGDAGYRPPVSLLKPVRGLDPEAYENFVSFCQQDYDSFEVLFGVDSPADPVVPVIERLQRDYPERAIALIVAPVCGTNRKASTLHVLAGQARHEILVISDSDCRVTPDYLHRVVAPLRDEAVGMVTCPYRGEKAVTFTAKLEALYIGSTFVPLVLAARKYITMRLGLGATMAVRRSDLDRIGGFAAFADYLGDDYQLGHRISALGRRVHLSHYVVACVLGATTFREQWNREVRWMRDARVCRPREYPIVPLTFSTPLAAILVLVSGFANTALLALVVSILLRWLVGWLITGFTGDVEARRAMIWLPLRDMLSAVVWAAGGVGRKIVWRGETFLLRRDGRLEAPAEPAPRPETLGPG
jgi:ceramide glucosyltransferase